MAENQLTANPPFEQDDYTGAVTLLLSNGGGTIIDIELFEWACQWRWKRHNTNGRKQADGQKGPPHWRAARSISKGGGPRQVYLSREIVQPPPGLIAEHKNRNALDNRRSNLRACTQFQNIKNNGPRCTKRGTPYKGVYWDKMRRKWAASSRNFDRNCVIGFFSTDIEAAKAYNEFVKVAHGEYAYLNPV